MKLRSKNKKLKRENKELRELLNSTMLIKRNMKTPMPLDSTTLRAMQKFQAAEYDNFTKSIKTMIEDAVIEGLAIEIKKYAKVETVHLENGTVVVKADLRIFKGER